MAPRVITHIWLGQPDPNSRSTARDTSRTRHMTSTRLRVPYTLRSFSRQVFNVGHCPDVGWFVTRSPKPFPCVGWFRAPHPGSAAAPACGAHRAEGTGGLGAGLYERCRARLAAAGRRRRRRSGSCTAAGAAIGVPGARPEGAAQPERRGPAHGAPCHAAPGGGPAHGALSPGHRP